MTPAMRFLPFLLCLFLGSCASSVPLRKPEPFASLIGKTVRFKERWYIGPYFYPNGDLARFRAFHYPVPGSELTIDRSYKCKIEGFKNLPDYEGAFVIVTVRTMLNREMRDVEFELRSPDREPASKEVAVIGAELSRKSNRWWQVVE